MKNTIVVGVIALSVFLAASVQSSARERVPFCERSDLSQVEPGFKCRTRMGVVFERVQVEGLKLPGTWVDTESGHVWSMEMGKMGQSAAAEMCAVHGGHLPSRGEITQGELNGLSDVFPMQGTTSWLAEEAVAYYLNGRGDFVTANPATDAQSIRCVANHE
jgi:hypothetical protein